MQVISASTSPAVGPALLPGGACVNSPTHVLVRIHDEHDELVADVDASVLTARLHDATTQAVPVEVQRVAPGVLRAAFTPLAPGAHRLALSVRGAPLAGSPWCIGVAGEPDRSVRSLCGQRHDNT